ncbi:MAG: exonuclease SbcCD subunit D [Oscillospiraceae bacterium]
MNRPLKIIHAADLHLDSPFDALGDKAARRRAEQRQLLERIAALARERQADLLLLAGDLLDGANVYAETARALQETLAGLDCPVFIAPGNHDYFCAASPYARLAFPDHVHIFRGGTEAVELPDLGVRVYGAGFTDIGSPPPLRGFHAAPWEGLNIGVFHGDLDKPESRYGPISQQDIGASGLDYLALGHVHSCSGLLQYGNTYCAYPGCPEGRGFDECGEKGVLYLELEKGRCRAEFVPVCLRQYLVLSVPADDPAAALPAGTEPHIVRLLLTGETDAAPDLDALYRELSPRFFALQLRDRTTPRRDIWEAAEQDSLRGLFLRRLRAMYEAAATEAEREQIIQAVRWGLAALDGGEAVAEL